METELNLKDKKVRLQEALRILGELEAKGILRYGIQQKTGITHNTMSYWIKGFWHPSPKVLARLQKFHREVLNGTIKAE